MIPQKNETVAVHIRDMGQDGSGIGQADGYTLFVKDAVIGDTVRVLVTKTKKHYGYGRLQEILEPSPYRVVPRCPIAGPCGGCQLQQLSYEQQLILKENRIRSDLARIGGFPEIPFEGMLGMAEPYRYRFKAQYPIGLDKDGRITAGFYAGRTHAIIPCRDCVLGPKINEEILNQVIAYMEEEHIAPYDEKSGEGFVRHVLIRSGFATGEILVCLIVNGEKLPHEERLVQRLCTIKGMTGICLNVNRKKTNVILGEDLRILWGQGWITDELGGIRFRISPKAFYQVNPAMTEKLYAKAAEYAGLTGSETVWDLYCGIGTISLTLSQKAARVYGVEIVPEAIRDAQENARLNHIQNTQFFVGKAEEVLPAQMANPDARADVIVVDPPRKGCAPELLDTILHIAPSRIVYVSCDPATLARDLRILCESGYTLQRVCAVDQFAQTVHIESVVLLSRK